MGGRVWDHASVNGSRQRWSPYDIVIAISALALLELAVLAGRYGPDRRAFTVPGYRQFLVAPSAVSAVAVVSAGIGIAAIRDAAAQPRGYRGR